MIERVRAIYCLLSGAMCAASSTSAARRVAEGVNAVGSFP